MDKSLAEKCDMNMQNKTLLPISENIFIFMQDQNRKVRIL